MWQRGTALFFEVECRMRIVHMNWIAVQKECKVLKRVALLVFYTIVPYKRTCKVPNFFQIKVLKGKTLSEVFLKNWGALGFDYDWRKNWGH